MRLLVLGASGMLGHAMFRVLQHCEHLEVYGTLRSVAAVRRFPQAMANRLLTGVEARDPDSVSRLFGEVRPDVVVNCIGLVKQLAQAADPLQALPVNGLLPHRLAQLCELCGARLIHISTDCVFSGARGCYSEQDVADARDLYGLSKYLGEVDAPHAVTLRTSINGHEMRGGLGLIDWFLDQQDRCPGFRRAVFSGLPTITLAQIVRDVIIPHTDLRGLYHIAAEPIAKYDLLELVAEVYGKPIDIVPVDSPVVDRSLDARKFAAATGYVVPPWPELIAAMHADFQETKKQRHVQG
jgi:dTDP-4-dehydrorhamnose reductase